MSESNIKTDVIVIGGGISGLLTALALSKEGKDVLLFEKDNFLGGNARSYKVGEYMVDTGPHAITGIHNNGPLLKLMNQYAGGIPKMIEHGHYYFRTKNKLYTVPASIKDGVFFDVIPAKDRLLLSKLLVSELIKNTIYRNEEYSVYDKIKDYRFSKKTLRLIDTLCHFMSGRSMEETPSKRLLSGFSVEGINGLNLKDCSYALKRILISHNVSHGHCYPKGGLKKIILKIKDSLPQNKVTIMKNSNVQKILIEDEKATGVKVDKIIYKSDIVIYTGFVKDLGKMVDKKLPKRYESKLKKIKQARSYTLWLGLKTRLKEMNYKGSEIWFESGEPFWAMPTSNLDKTLAPRGKQLVSFCFVIKDDLEKTKKDAWKTIKYVFPDIEDKIEMKHEQVTIPEKAAITINSFFPGPVSPFKNLYFAGTDTDPRSMGLTRAAYSVEELLKVLKDFYI